MLLTGSYVSTIDKQFINKFTTKNADELWLSAVTILRIGIGAQLAILALTEKLIYPGLAVVFIEMFPFQYIPSNWFKRWYRYAFCLLYRYL